MAYDTEMTLNTLYNNLRRAGKIVNGIDVYIDTIVVLLYRDTNDFSLAHAKIINRGKIVPTKTNVYDCYLLLRIHQPSKQLIEYIRGTAPKHVVCRVDISIDFRADDHDRARQILSFLYRHVTPTRRKRGLRVRIIKGQTIYFSPAGAPRNIVMYPRRSKFSGIPVAHFELRFSGARRCKAIGIRLIDDVFTFDVADAISRTCRLSAVILPKLERRLLRRNEPGRQRLSSRLVEKVKATFLHSLPNTFEDPEWDDLPVQECLDRYPRLLRGCVVHLPVKALIKTTFRIDWDLSS
jgi:hypothetical protein